MPSKHRLFVLFDSYKSYFIFNNFPHIRKQHMSWNNRNNLLHHLEFHFCPNRKLQVIFYVMCHISKVFKHCINSRTPRLDDIYPSLTTYRSGSLLRRDKNTPDRIYNLIPSRVFFLFHEEGSSSHLKWTDSFTHFYLVVLTLICRVLLISAGVRNEP